MVCQKKNKKKKKWRKEKKYDVKTLEEALNAIGRGQTIREAAYKFDIPKSTLHAKLQNKYPLDCKQGPSTILPQNEEAEIKTSLLESQKRGFPIIKAYLLDSV